MTILQIAPIEGNYHPFQSQSHRRECWLPGWVAVPEALVKKLEGCLGYCELVMEGEVLKDILPAEPPKPEPVPSAGDDMEALLVEALYRLSLLEMEVK